MTICITANQSEFKSIEALHAHIEKKFREAHKAHPDAEIVTNTNAKQ